MCYLLLYDVVDQFGERRTPYRDAHLKLARAAADNGELLLGGAFADPLDGAALVAINQTRRILALLAALAAAAGIPLKPWRLL
jgi:hypothetical protein